MSVLFISHSSRDAATAASVKRRLERMGHRSLFLDFDPEKGIAAGASWERTLYTKLRACRAVLAICTERFIASHWCFAELALARMEGKEVLALLCAPWRKGTKIPAILGSEQLLDLRGDREQGFERLRKALEAKGIAPSEHRAWTPDEPPYPGLLAYRQEEEAIFFGRDEETRKGIELLARMRRQGFPRLALVLGSSGVGKSSLVRAGIVPRLRRNPARWLPVEPFRPGNEPVAQLSAALAKAFRDAGEPIARAEIAGELRAGGGPGPTPVARPAAPPSSRRRLEALAALEAELAPGDRDLVAALGRLRQMLLEHDRTARPAANESNVTSIEPLARLVDDLLLAAGPSEATMVVVIDQLEEALGATHEHPEGSRFLALLRRTLAVQERLLVVATMRTDFLDDFQQDESVAGIDFESFTISPMGSAHLREVIEEPARLGSIRIETGLVDRLLSDTGSADALPLLAFTLRSLWERCHRSGTLDLAAYEQLGGLHGAIAQVADEALAGALRLGDENDLRRAFLALARPAREGGGWASQPLAWRSLPDPDRALPMLRHFQSHRLLVVRENDTFEVAHEALFRAWERFRRWLEASAAALQLQAEIRVDGQRWQQASADDRPHYLLSGWRLQRALDLRATGDLLLGQPELELLRASQERERQRRRTRAWRRRAGMAALALLAAILSVLTAFALRAKKRAEEQRSKAIAVAARSGSYRLDRALLMAAEAASEPSFEARTSLLHLLQAEPRLIAFLHGHSGLVWALAFDPEGDLASGGADRTIRRWSLREEAERACRRTGPKVVALGIDAEGRPVGIGGGGGELLTWTAGGLEVAPHDADLRGVFTGAFGQGGSPQAVGTTDGRICVGTERGRPSCVDDAHRGFVNRLAFGPDGLLASAGRDGTVRVWQRVDGRLEPLWKASGHRGGATAIVFGGDRHRPDAFLATGSAVGTLRSFDAATGRLRYRTDAHRDAIVSLATNRSETGPALIASAGTDGAVRVWRQLDADRWSPWLTFADSRGGAYSLAFDDRGERLASGGRDGLIRLWDLGARAPEVYELLGQHDETRGFAFAPDGTWAATGDLGGNARTWELASEAAIRPAAELAVGGEANAIDASHHGELVIGGGGTRLSMWHRATGLERWARPRVGWTTDLDLRPDGRWLAASIGGRLHLVDPRQGPPSAPTAAAKPVTSVALDPHGARLATGHDDGSVSLWRIDNGRPVEPEPLQASIPDASGSQVPALAFGPRRTYLAAAAGAHDIGLWNLKTRSRVAVLSGHDGAIRSLQLDASGQRLASSGDDGTVRVWAIPSGEPLYALIGHTGIVYRAAFTADGTEVLSGADDRTIRRWPIHLIEDLTAARRRAGELANRRLTAWERTVLLDQRPGVLGPPVGGRLEQNCPD